MDGSHAPPYLGAHTYTFVFSNPPLHTSDGQGKGGLALQPSVPHRLPLAPLFPAPVSWENVASGLVRMGGKWRNGGS